MRRLDCYSAVIVCWVIAACALLLAVLMGMADHWKHALGFFIAFIAAFAFGWNELSIALRIRREAMQRPPFTTTARGFPEQPRRPLS